MLCSSINQRLVPGGPLEDLKRTLELYCIVVSAKRGMHLILAFAFLLFGDKSESLEIEKKYLNYSLKIS